MNGPVRFLGQSRIRNRHNFLLPLQPQTQGAESAIRINPLISRLKIHGDVGVPGRSCAKHRICLLLTARSCNAPTVTRSWPNTEVGATYGIPARSRNYALDGWLSGRATGNG